MGEHLIVATDGPSRGPGCAKLLADAVTLARTGVTVTVLLVQDGVEAVAPCATEEASQLVDAGATLLVDRYSLGQRGLRAEDVRQGRIVALDAVTGPLLNPAVSVVWR